MNVHVIILTRCLDLRRAGRTFMGDLIGHEGIVAGAVLVFLWLA